MSTITTVILGILITLLIIILTFRSEVYRCFKYKAEILKDFSTTYRLTPYWSYLSDKSVFRLTMWLIFGKIRVKEFRNWSPVNSRKAIAGVVVWHKNKKEGQIELRDIVFDISDEVKIKRILGEYVHELFMSYRGYDIIMWTKNEEKALFLADSLKFSEHTRLNLIPKTDPHMGNSIKAFILYKEK